MVADTKFMGTKTGMFDFAFRDGDNALVSCCIHSK